MTLDQIHEEWAVDSKINKFELDECSRLTPELHAKYLALLSKAKDETHAGQVQAERTHAPEMVSG